MFTEKDNNLDGVIVFDSFEKGHIIDMPDGRFWIGLTQASYDGQMPEGARQASADEVWKFSVKSETAIANYMNSNFYGVTKNEKWFALFSQDGTKILACGGILPYKNTIEPVFTGFQNKNPLDTDIDALFALSEHLKIPFSGHWSMHGGSEHNQKKADEFLSQHSLSLKSI